MARSGAAGGMVSYIPRQVRSEGNLASPPPPIHTPRPIDLPGEKRKRSEPV